jgi:hypothetical protein
VGIFLLSFREAKLFEIEGLPPMLGNSTLFKAEGNASFVVVLVLFFA